ncbi:protein PIF-like isoform X2 [Mya arenaria]|uniref:protein PIF-like isoform X2 n=1 Tax=Mya arenaria TaxID=6604 RepID=UPI0022E050DD|nr:protein PIF-like isoform X2 [Mya arenaria]
MPRKSSMLGVLSAFAFITIVFAQQGGQDATAMSGCHPIADIIFLLDGSDSISDQEFAQQRDFVRRFVEMSGHVGPDSIRVGVAVVSSGIGDELPLSSNMSRDALLVGIQRLAQPQEGSRTDLGLVEMEQLFTAQGRRGVLRIGVVLTDGRAKFERATEGEAQVAKDGGVFLVAIGVGRLIKTVELEKIASTKNNAYNLEPLELSTRMLYETVQYLGAEACSGHFLVDQVNKPDPGTPHTASKAGSMVSEALTATVMDLPVAATPLVATTATGTKSTTNTETTSRLTPRPKRTRPTSMAMVTEALVQPSTRAPPITVETIQENELPFAKPSMAESHGNTLTQIQRLLIPDMATGPNENGFHVPAQTVEEALASLQRNVHPGTQPAQQTFADKVKDIAMQFMDNQIFGPPASERISMDAGRNRVYVEPALGVGQTQKVTSTTTRKPTPTTTPKIKAPINKTEFFITEQCSKGHFIDGISYTYVADSCTEFLQCSHDNGQVRVRRIRCPFETFFDDTKTVCQHYRKTSCWRDPCYDFTVHSYGHPDRCRSYWRCEGGMSVPTCCASGTVYTPEVGCTRNTSCEDTCMDFGSIDKMTATSQCKMLAIPEDPHFYFEWVAGMGWLVRRCALGSTFSQAQCTCRVTNEVISRSCRPEFYLDFKGSIKDMSGNNIYMGNTNVALDGDTGFFNGAAVLTLWRFSGMSFGDKVTITFRFRVSVTAPKGELMHLVSNCCHQCREEPKPSLDIAIIPGDRGGIAVFSITTREAGETFLFVPYKDTITGWNWLHFRYDGLTLSGAINQQSASRETIGRLEAKTEALIIGACGQKGTFNGFIDQFKFYMCNPR